MKIKEKKLKSYFTLVELIIVIAIISVLSVTGFMIISKWIGKSRNSSRYSDITQILNSLEVYFIENNNYPDPDNYVNITDNSGSIIGYQGIFDGTASSQGIALSQIPKDPKDNTEYSYIKIINPQKGFEIGTMLEEEYLAINNIAIAGIQRKPYVLENHNYKSCDNKGNLQFPDFLILLNTREGDFIKKTNFFITGGNSGHIIVDIKNLTGNCNENVRIINIQITGDSLAIENNDLVIFSTGLTIDEDGESPLNGSCNTQPKITNALFSTGNPSQSNQSRSFDDSSPYSDCSWKCNAGYYQSGNNCIAYECDTQPIIANADFNKGNAIQNNQSWIYDGTSPYSECSWKCQGGYYHSGNSCVMTGDLTNYATVTARTQYNGPPSDCIDDNFATFYRTLNYPVFESDNERLKFDFGAGFDKVIAHLRIQGRGLTPGGRDTDPHIFYIQGSTVANPSTARNHSDWTDLTAYLNYPCNGCRLQYDFSNSTVYRHIRIWFISGGQSMQRMQVAEVELF